MIFIFYIMILMFYTIIMLFITSASSGSSVSSASSVSAVSSVSLASQRLPPLFHSYERAGKGLVSCLCKCRSKGAGLNMTLRVKPRETTRNYVKLRERIRGSIMVLLWLKRLEVLAGCARYILYPRTVVS